MTFSPRFNRQTIVRNHRSYNFSLIPLFSFFTSLRKLSIKGKGIRNVQFVEKRKMVNFSEIFRSDGMFSRKKDLPRPDQVSLVSMTIGVFFRHARQ